jgi:hypothetical protein
MSKTPNSKPGAPQRAPTFSMLRSFKFWALFEKYVIDRHSGFIRRLAEPQPAARIFPGTTALPEIPPAPLYQRGVGGDFRKGSSKQDFLANFKIFYFDRLRDESRTFRTEPIFHTPK